MSKQHANRPVKISITACPECQRVYEPLPGGRTCEECGVRTVTALVILPAASATIERAAGLLTDVLARMRASTLAR
jgi:hypothetical protein